jgi:hypothetical protein
MKLFLSLIFLFFPGVALANWFQSPVAITVPFDNATNGFTADEVQSAIEEARNTAEGKARFIAVYGFDGVASTGRWLELHQNVGSDVTGYVAPLDIKLENLSASCASSTTVTFTVYKNISTSVATLTITSNRKGYTAVNVTIAPLDEISVKVTSGSCSKPGFSVHMRVI